MNNYTLYASIATKYDNPWYIPYEILLKTFEWQDFRKSVF